MVLAASLGAPYPQVVPNEPVPRAIFETLSPVRPRKRYFITVSHDYARLPAYWRLQGEGSHLQESAGGTVAELTTSNSRPPRGSMAAILFRPERRSLWRGRRT